MVQFVDLWLAVLVSAIVLFVASAIIWMATPLHKHDYKDPGDKEGPLLDALRAANLRPGAYHVPWCSPEQSHDPATQAALQAKLRAGPWALLYVLDAPPNMGKNLGMWFVHLLIVGVFVAYAASISGLAPGAEYLSVFRVVTTSALLAHAGYAFPMAIWHGMPWSQVPGRLIDGAIYALLTGACFAGFWPEATAGVA